jgi:hypothetical protein
MQELWTVTKVFFWAVLLACTLVYVVNVVKAHYINSDWEHFKSEVESGV